MINNKGGVRSCPGNVHRVAWYVFIGKTTAKLINEDGDGLTTISDIIQEQKPFMKNCTHLELNLTSLKVAISFSHKKIT